MKIHWGRRIESIVTGYALLTYRGDPDDLLFLQVKDAFAEMMPVAPIPGREYHVTLTIQERSSPQEQT